MCIFIKEFISPTAGDWLSKVLVTCKVQDEFNNFKIVPTTVGKFIYLLGLIILGVFVFIFLLVLKQFDHNCLLQFPI